MYVISIVKDRFFKFMSIWPMLVLVGRIFFCGSGPDPGDLGSQGEMDFIRSHRKNIKPDDRK